MSDFTVCWCELKDCIHYTPEPADVKKCRCLHPDKPAYMKNVKCPLYRMDWQKQLREADPGLLERKKRRNW